MNKKKKRQKKYAKKNGPGVAQCGWAPGWSRTTPTGLPRYASVHLNTLVARSPVCALASLPPSLSVPLSLRRLGYRLSPPYAREVSRSSSVPSPATSAYRVFPSLLSPSCAKSSTQIQSILLLDAYYLSTNFELFCKKISGVRPCMSLLGPPLGTVVCLLGFGRSLLLKWRSIADDRSGCTLYWGFDGRLRRPG